MWGMLSSAALLVEFCKVHSTKTFVVWTWDLSCFNVPLAAAVSCFLLCRLQTRNITISQPWQTEEPNHPYLLSKMHCEECPRNGNFLMWLTCSILMSVDGTWIFKHWYAFFSINMKDVLLQKEFISWTVLFHGIVGISAPDKSTFWSGAYLQVCQGGQHCMAMGRFLKSPD